MGFRKGVSATITFAAIAAADGTAMTTGTPVEDITKDGGTQAACTNAAVHEGKGQWSLVLTAAEMDADDIGVLITMTNMVPVNLNIKTVPDTILEEGTAQAGAAGSITLQAGAVATDGYYDGQTLVIVKGTGVGQAKLISSYIGSTKVASVGSNWAINPDATSIYVVLPFGGVTLTAAEINTECDTAISDAALATAANLATVDANVDAVLVDTGTSIPATLSTIIGYIDTEIAAILVDTGTTLDALIQGLNDPDTATIVAGIMGEAIETGITFKEAIQYIGAACAGKTSGMGTATATIKGMDNATTRIVATQDVDGNRSAVTLT
jgi:hypothetical protein